MKEYASKLLDKALDAIEAAEGLTNMGKAEFAAGRAYYAMFYTAEALLFDQFDLKLNRHGQVIAAYGKHFAKTKELNPKYHRWLRDGFEKAEMIQVKIYYDREGNTLTVWFGDPADEVLAVSQREYVSEETGEEVVLMKDRDGKVIGFEKLNFAGQSGDVIKVAFETVAV